MPPYKSQMLYFVGAEQQYLVRDCILIISFLSF